MDYYSTGRTNYFKVKDVEEFQKWVTSFGGQFIESSKKKPLVGLLLDNGIPDMRHGPDDELIEFDFWTELKDHLTPEQVAIWMEAGSEGHRYIIGQAIAVMAGTKKEVNICTDSIYELAAKKFKVPVNSISQACY